MKPADISRWLIKIDRTAAWTLLVTVLLFFLSGYGMTLNLINREFSSAFHRSILPPVVMTAFIFHTSLAVRMALMRWRIWRRPVKAGLAAIYLLLFLGFVYFQYFRAAAAPKSADPVPVSVTAPDQPGSTVSPEQTRTFSSDELSEFDGQNNRQAYAAVDGIVYDLTGVFKAGVHFGHLAGRDLTSAFFKQHIKSQITKYPVVGTLRD